MNPTSAHYLKTVRVRKAKPGRLIIWLADRVTGRVNRTHSQTRRAAGLCVLYVLLFAVLFWLGYQHLTYYFAYIANQL